LTQCSSASLLARDAQAKLALIVAQCLSIHLSICVSVRDSLIHAYVRSIARREPRRLPACRLSSQSINQIKQINHSITVALIAEPLLAILYTTLI